MKFSNFIYLFAGLALVGILATGCGQNSDARDEDHTATEHADEGVTFKEGKGLRVPKKTADFIGLKIVDVSEQQFPSTLRFTAKIYRRESGNVLASGIIGQADAKRLQVGQALTIKIEGTGEFQGKVSTLNREMEKVSGQVEVLLEIADVNQSLSVGTHLPITMSFGKEEAVIGVPRTALLQTVEGNFVYTVSGDHLVRSEVKVGESHEDVIEIKDGLYAGDQVVVNPVMTLWMAELQSIRGGQACADGH